MNLSTAMVRPKSPKRPPAPAADLIEPFTR